MSRSATESVSLAYLDSVLSKIGFEKIDLACRDADGRVIVLWVSKEDASIAGVPVIDGMILKAVARDLLADLLLARRLSMDLLTDLDDGHLLLGLGENR